MMRHPNGRSCSATEDLVNKYERRAQRAEQALVRAKQQLDASEDARAAATRAAVLLYVAHREVKMDTDADRELHRRVLAKAVEALPSLEKRAAQLAEAMEAKSEPK